MKRALEASPWSFSGNLLILQQLNPKVPIHHLIFCHCAFWVHVVGLPLVMVNEAVLRRVGNFIGKVVDVKMEAKEGGHCKMGKVRVMIDLKNILLSGMILKLNDDQLWVDFKYDRLPRFCYSCGRIGHYTTSCDKMQYRESESGMVGDGKFGSWFRAEACEASPFWKLFFGNKFPMPNEDEVVLETQNQEVEEGAEPVETNTQNLHKSMEIVLDGRTKRKGKEPMVEIGAVKGRRNVGKPLLLLDIPWSEVCLKNMTNMSKKIKKTTKSPATKRLRWCPSFTSNGVTSNDLDETQLLETPISIDASFAKWAMKF